MLKGWRPESVYTEDPCSHERDVLRVRTRAPAWRSIAMRSTRWLGSGEWQRSLLALAAPALVLAMATGCKTKSQEATPDEAGAPAASASADTSEVAAPPPVVAGDPDVPVNEGIVGTQQLPSDYFADTAPPAPPVEDKPSPPAASNVWVPGYWWWSRTTSHYVWVPGGWRDPPPQQSWTPGEWLEVSAGRYSWRPGYWGPTGYVPPAFVTVAPPPPRVEVEPPMPGVGYYWTPGYYAWRGGVYEWTVGTWVRPPYEGVTWVEPCYVNMGGRYYYQPGRWDRPIDRRGVAYRPDPNIRPGMHFTPQPLPGAVVAAHAGYVSSSYRAAAQGATRTPTGGWSSHGGGNWHPGNATPVAGGPGVAHPGGNEPHPGALPGTTPAGGPGAVAGHEQPHPWEHEGAGNPGAAGNEQQHPGTGVHVGVNPGQVGAAGNEHPGTGVRTGINPGQVGAAGPVVHPGGGVGGEWPHGGGGQGGQGGHNGQGGGQGGANPHGGGQGGGPAPGHSGGPPPHNK